MQVNKYISIAYICMNMYSTYIYTDKGKDDECTTEMGWDRREKRREC